MILVRNLVSMSLACFLAIPAPLVSQQPPPPQPPAPAIGFLRVRVLEGQNATNNVTTRGVTIPVVEVRDPNDRPVEGASVVFELPAAGPGGFFPGSRTRLAVRTNYQGQAAAGGFEPNTQTGRFQIKVTATQGSAVGSASIVQMNSKNEFAVAAPKKRSHTKRWIIVGVAAGAAAGLTYYFVTRSNGSPAASASGPPIILIPGPVTIGGPR